jgi:hypothetical protein
MQIIATATGSKPMKRRHFFPANLRAGLPRDRSAPGASEWTGICANHDGTRTHVANEEGEEPLHTVVQACGTITCSCRGEPDEESEKIFAGIGATCHDIAEASSSLKSTADRCRVRVGRRQDLRQRPD